MRGALRTEVVFLHLQAPIAVLEERLARRTGHFMPASLLRSQLDTLEPLVPDEPGAVLDATLPFPDVVDQALRAIAALSRPHAPIPD